MNHTESAIDAETVGLCPLCDGPLMPEPPRYRAGQLSRAYQSYLCLNTEEHDIGPEQAIRWFDWELVQPRFDLATYRSLVMVVDRPGRAA
jgi:hypothetical protein